MLAFYKFKNRSDDWLEFRRKYITATEASSVVGVYPYVSMRKMLEDKKTPSEKLHNPFLRAGLGYEPSVLEFIRVDLGWQVSSLLPAQEDTVVFTDPSNTFSATPDAFRWSNTTSVVEAKVTNYNNFYKNWLTGKVPDWYICQVQVQMLCTGLSEGWIVCMLPEASPILSIHRIEYSEDFIELLKNTLVEVREGNLTKVPNGVKAIAIEQLTSSVKEHIVSEYKDD